ncbi:HD domain, partial [Musa troglodytarum]
MGECGVPPSQREQPAMFRDGAATDRRFVKHVFDNVHGSITLDPVLHAWSSQELYTLDLSIPWVFIGLLGRQFVGSEIDIDCYDVQTVKLAGLLHDIGHGPFSHMFEHEFLPQAFPGSEWSHEQMFDYIGRDCRACGLGCNFQFQRLLEGMRVMDDEICYPAKEYLNIHKLFATRADLHRTVYTHAKVKAIELMVVDALVKANDYLKISSYPFDPAQFWKLDDTILKTIEFADSKKLKESRNIIQRIRRRDLYQFCNEYAVPKDKLEHFKDVTPQDVVCSQKANGVQLKVEDIAVSNVKIDLTRGKHNPLESVKKFSITDDRISHLLPASCQDRIVRVYAKKPELVEAVSEAFENLQLKIYGVKTQVHETPEAKKQR